MVSQSGSGRLIDIEQPGVHLPSTLVVDTNLIVARLRPAHRPIHLQIAERANRFFTLLREQHAIGLIPAVVCQELFHFVLRDLYQAALPTYRLALMSSTQRRRFDWNDLYKMHPDLFVQFSSELEKLLRVFRGNNLRVIQPEELGPIPHGRRLEEELLRVMDRYQLDSADAALLLDARRAGIATIATLDADLRWAQSDFDIYTWL